MRLLATGGTGFVGRAVVRGALARGAAVHCLVRGGRTGTPAGASCAELGPAPWSEEAIGRALGAFAPDRILHLAGDPFALSIEALFESNAFLCHRLLAAARRAAPQARIVVVGSAAEYGPPLRADGCSCEDDRAAPVSAYGAAKLAQTALALAAASAGQLITVARLFNPVGPGMPAGLAFADFAERLAGGADRLVTGDIDTQRDFLSVDEAARILLDLLAHDGRSGLVVNVCSGVPQPVRAGVERLIGSLGRPVELTVKADAARSSGVRTIFGDTGRLRSLGIEPACADIGPALDALLRDVLIMANSDEASTRLNNSP